MERMSILADVIAAAEKHRSFVEQQAEFARNDTKFRKELVARWEAIRSANPMIETPTGLKLPRLALPETNEPAEVARYLYGQGLPGQFPFLNGAYREMYLT